MAVSLGFHIIFAVFGVGLPWLLLIHGRRDAAARAVVADPSRRTRVSCGSQPSRHNVGEGCHAHRAPLMRVERNCLSAFARSIAVDAQHDTV